MGRYTCAPRFGPSPCPCSGAAVSAAHDKKFFNIFSLVLGILILIALGIWVLARNVAVDTQEAHVQQDPAMQAAVNDRIAPVAKLAVSGEDNSALAAAKPAAAEPAAELPGEEVYSMACIACHGAGVAGAPKQGDKAAWAPRIAKGADTLHKHALEGFQGQAGFMPPKGGRVDLADKSVMNAVDFMVAASK
jgi:cytochrome c5